MCHRYSRGFTFTQGSTGIERCVPRESQLAVDAGQKMGVDHLLTFDPSSTTLDTCVNFCSNLTQCCIAQFTYSGIDPSGSCRRLAMDALGQAPLQTGYQLFYKLIPSDPIAASSVRSNESSDSIVRAKNMGSGLYAQCQAPPSVTSDADAAAIGSSTSRYPDWQNWTVQQCFDACDMDSTW